jgi:folate-binding protein YgfZ
VRAPGGGGPEAGNEPAARGAVLHMETATAPVPAPQAPVSPLLAVHGAVPAEGQDTGVAWHYGDPTREQRLLTAGQAVTDLSHRGVVRVAGPDRLTWLHSLTSQHLSALPAGRSVESLLLTPHGHIEQSLHLVDDGEAVWITVEPGSREALIGWLEKMRFMLRVEISDQTDAWAAVGAVLAADADAAGPLAAVLAAAGETPPAWQDPWPRTEPGSVSYAVVDDADHPGLERDWREVLLPRDRFAALLDGVPLAGSWAAEALRVAAWRPRFGFETDHRTIPHEADWLRTAVHLTKGCYRGQETVARVHNLGRPPRRLVMLHLDGSEHTLPEHGDLVVFGERSIGQITTAARHHELGPIALAMIKRSTPVEEQLTVGGVAAAQEVVVRP